MLVDATRSAGPSDEATAAISDSPDATSTTGVGTAITNPSLHIDGKVDVIRQFNSTCSGCH